MTTYTRNQDGGTRLNVREAPGNTTRIIAAIAPGDTFAVMGDPVKAGDHLMWWPVSSPSAWGGIGWASLESAPGQPRFGTTPTWLGYVPGSDSANLDTAGSIGTRTEHVAADLEHVRDELQIILQQLNELIEHAKNI